MRIIKYYKPVVSEMQVSLPVEQPAYLDSAARYCEAYLGPFQVTLALNDAFCLYSAVGVVIECSGMFVALQQKSITSWKF